MKLYATITSERASKGQGGNDYIIFDASVGRVPVAQFELYYNKDTAHGATTDEWVLSWRPEGSAEDNEWTILAQGNVIPAEKGEKQ